MVGVCCEVDDGCEGVGGEYVLVGEFVVVV